MDVIVIGGGIGGLALALSLHQAGISVRVYEAASDVKPLGVGINLQPTAVRELVELGLGNDLARIGNPTRFLKYFNKFGQHIHEEPRGLEAGYRWPQYSIHRGQLQMLLLAAVRNRIGTHNVRTGARLASFEQHPDQVTAIVQDIKTGTIHIDHASVLIGADGIHSAVRHQLHPTEGEPRFARQILWRAATEAEPFLGGHTMIIAGHLNQRIIVYPIAPAKNSNLQLVNWICQTAVPEGTFPREDWNRHVAKDRVLNAFGTWRFPWLDLPGLIDRTSEIYEFPLIDRDPLDVWTSERVTLLGDAAHPMYPIGSQAGSQAIIDARLLTRMLLSHSSSIVALQKYDQDRRPAMNDIVLRNRNFGPEIAMQLVEERAPNGFRRIEDVISKEELHSTTNSFSVAAGLDVERVNNRPSFLPTAWFQP